MVNVKNQLDLLIIKVGALEKSSFEYLDFGFHL